MFNLNLLSIPGVQLQNDNTTISFVVDDPTPKIKAHTQTPKGKTTPRRQKKSISILFASAIIIVGAVFYFTPHSMPSLENRTTYNELTSDVVMDKVLNIILKSRSQYSIESLQFKNHQVLINLKTDNMDVLKSVQEKFCNDKGTPLRIFSESNQYFLLTKLPWNIDQNGQSNITTEVFFQNIQPGKNIETKITDNEIAMRGPMGDIISIFLQMANSNLLHSDEMVLHTAPEDSLIFIISVRGDV